MKSPHKETTSQPSNPPPADPPQVCIIGKRGGTPDVTDTLAPAVTPGPSRSIPAGSSPLGKPITPSAFSVTLTAFRDSVEKILREHGDELNRSERIRLVQWVRGELILKKKAGRRPLLRVTRAYQAWKEGKSGVALYSAHIPGWDRMSRWRRQSEVKRLLAAIHSRRRRDAKTRSEHGGKVGN